MIFTLSFYIFSLLLSYTDCTKFRIPNITIFSLFIFLVIFGYFEEQLSYISFIISFAILLFFVIILLIMPKQILGGGDIKYMMLIAIYINPMLFPLFLLFTGLIQMFFLIFVQKFKKRKVAPMAPAMFLSVVFVDIIFNMGFYP